jgi:hypothetical protein
VPEGLRGLLTRAQRRWLIGSFARQLVLWLTVASVIALLVRGAERLLPFTVDWLLAAGVAAGAAAVLAALVSWWRMPSPIRLAALLDERSALRDALSTAVAIAGRDDPWALATVQYAERAAGRVVLRDAMPLGLPRWSVAPLALAGVVALLGLTPRVDLTQRMAAKPAVPEQAEIVQARAQVEESIEELRQVVSGIESDELRDLLDNLLDPMAQFSDPDEIRREALKGLDELEQRLAELAENELAATLDDFADRMKGVDAAGMPDLKNLIDAMQRGDFADAEQAFEKLAAMMNDPSLPEELRQSIAQQLEQLAAAMQEAAAQNQELANKLREAGVDPAVMNNLEQLREALENAGLSQEQVEQLMQDAKENQATQQALQRMAGSCQQCASGAKPRDGSQRMNAGQQGMEEQLRQMATSQQQQQQAMEAMRSLAMSRAAIGQGMSSDDTAMMMIPQKYARQGGGPGNSWMRSDTGTEVDPSRYEIGERIQVSTPMGDGPILSSELVYADGQIVGQSRQAFREAVSRASNAANDAVSNTRVPLEYHEVIRRYFGELDRRAKQEPEPAPKE